MPGDSNIHVLGLVKTSTIRDQVLDVLNNVEHVTTKILLSDLSKAETAIIADKQAQVVLMEVEKSDKDVSETIEKIQASYLKKQVPLIIISKDLQHDQMIKLLRLGVSDFLSLPLDSDEAVSVIKRVAAQNRHLDSSQEAGGKVITFAHASGGMGATTLAVNAAVTINQACDLSGRSAACLLDFDLQFGGASIHLDLPGYSPVMDLFERPDRLDREMLEGMMMRHSSGLRILTTPEAPMPVEALNSDVIEELLQLAKKRYRYVIVDMPQTMTLWTDSVFQQSAAIYVVTQLNVPAIRQLKRWFRVLEQESLHGLPVKVVVTRYSPLGRMKNDNITIEQAAEALGRKINYTIPNDYTLISESLDQGIPACTIKPNGKFSKHLQVMLGDVVDEIALPQKGLWGKIMS